MEDVYRLILYNTTERENNLTEICENNTGADTEIPKKKNKITPPLMGEDKTCQRDTDFVTESNSTIDAMSDIKVAYFCVCDGHGGIRAAEYVKTHLFNNIIKHPQFKRDPEGAIRAGFAITENNYSDYAKLQDIDGMVGTTVTSVLIVDNALYVANIGDSQAVLCSNGKEFILTEAHIPSNPSENSRILLDGGCILSCKNGSKRLGHPIWNPKFVNLGITRAIGDLYFKNSEYIGEKKSGLIAIPNLMKWNLTVDDDFLVIASDGLWDVVSPKEVIYLVISKMHLDCDEICEHLIDISKKRSSEDNITILLVKFRLNGS